MVNEGLWGSCKPTRRRCTEAGYTRVASLADLLTMSTIVSTFVYCVCPPGVSGGQASVLASLPKSSSAYLFCGSPKAELAAHHFSRLVYTDAVTAAADPTSSSSQRLSSTNIVRVVLKCRSMHPLVSYMRPFLWYVTRAWSQSFRMSDRLWTASITSRADS